MPRFRRVQTITHDIGPAGQLVLAVTSADIRLAAVEGDTAELHATFEVRARDESEADTIFESAQLRVSASTGRLEAVEEGSDHGLGSAVGRLFGGHDVELARIEGTAPSPCRIEVRAVSGDVQATGFSGSQRYQTVSGDLRLVETGGEMEINSVSGDVSLRAVEPVSLRVNNVSGDLSAEAPTFRRIDANAVSGDLVVDGELDPVEAHTVETVSGDFRLASGSGMTISVRGLSSDVHSSLPHRVEGSADRRRLIVGDGAASLSFNSMSGDLSVTSSRQSSSTTATASAPKPSASAASPADTESPAVDERIDVLAALERGEIDVDEAMRRLGGE
jgi:Putative adhesin